jgi:hypothetical protein
MDGMAGEITSRNSAVDLNQPCPKKLLLQHTIFSQFGKCRSASRSSFAILIRRCDQLNDGWNGGTNCIAKLAFALESAMCQ